MDRCDARSIFKVGTYGLSFFPQTGELFKAEIKSSLSDNTIRWENHTASSSIWTRFSGSISYDNNHYDEPPKALHNHLRLTASVVF